MAQRCTYRDAVVEAARAGATRTNTTPLEGSTKRIFSMALRAYIWAVACCWSSKFAISMS
ncbi:MAG: hypothetical protein ACKOEM_18950 [Planctomycetia bacterium]